MTTDLVRFGVAMEADLLERFDTRIARRGYTTRSEALRDLIRADLDAEHIASGGDAAATLTLVYDHHVRELTERLTSMQHELGSYVVSTLHIHLDHDHCLEVIVMKGPAEKIQNASDRLVATKGVELGRLVMTALPSSHKSSTTHHDHSHPTTQSATPSLAKTKQLHDQQHNHSHNHPHHEHRHQHSSQSTDPIERKNTPERKHE